MFRKKPFIKNIILFSLILVFLPAQSPAEDKRPAKDTKSDHQWSITRSLSKAWKWSKDIVKEDKHEKLLKAYKAQKSIEETYKKLEESGKWCVDTDDEKGKKENNFKGTVYYLKFDSVSKKNLINTATDGCKDEMGKVLIEYTCDNYNGTQDDFNVPNVMTTVICLGDKICMNGTCRIPDCMDKDGKNFFEASHVEIVDKNSLDEDGLPTAVKKIPDQCKDQAPNEVREMVCVVKNGALTVDEISKDCCAYGMICDNGSCIIPPQSKQQGLVNDPCGDCPVDIDGDEICPVDDNCPFVANADQADSDQDGVGDACEEVFEQGVVTLSNGRSLSPHISPDGRYVVFKSMATNLTPDDNQEGQTHIYVRDLKENITKKITNPAAEAYNPFIMRGKGDNYYISFSTDSQIFLYNLKSGTTTLVSHAYSKTKGANSPSYSSSIGVKGDGSVYVVYQSSATDLTISTSEPPSSLAFYIYDVQSGTNSKYEYSLEGIDIPKNTTDATYSVGMLDLPTPARVSAGATDTASTGNYLILEEETATGLESQFSSSGVIYLYDLNNDKTELILLSPWFNPDISSVTLNKDGRYIAFNTEANLLLEDTNESDDIYVYDRDKKEFELISTPSPNNPNFVYNAMQPHINSTGRYVVYESSINTAPPYTSGLTNIFLRDRGTQKTYPVSINSSGESANGSSYDPSVSDDGRYVAFFSWANNLVEGDTNGEEDIFVRDMYEGKTILVSVPE